MRDYMSDFGCLGDFREAVHRIGAGVNARNNLVSMTLVMLVRAGRAVVRGREVPPQVHNTVTLSPLSSLAIIIGSITAIIITIAVTITIIMTISLTYT